MNVAFLLLNYVLPDHLRVLLIGQLAITARDVVEEAVASCFERSPDRFTEFDQILKAFAGAFFLVVLLSMSDKSKVEALSVQNLDDLLLQADQGEYQSLLLAEDTLEVIALNLLPQFIPNESLSHQPSHDTLNLGHSWVRLSVRIPVVVMSCLHLIRH